MTDCRHKCIRATLSLLAATALSLMLALGGLAASLTVDALHDHDCQGEECVACHVLSLARTLLESQCETASIQAVAANIAPAHAFVAATLWLGLSVETPVSRCDLLLI